MLSLPLSHTLHIHARSIQGYITSMKSMLVLLQLIYTICFEPPCTVGMSQSLHVICRSVLYTAMPGLTYVPSQRRCPSSQCDSIGFLYRKRKVLLNTFPLGIFSSIPQSLLSLPFSPFPSLHLSPALNECKPTYYFSLIK